VDLGLWHDAEVPWVHYDPLASYQTEERVDEDVDAGGEVELVVVVVVD
jgi:hypothetical protein